ncbi:MAG: UvrD-helicase domain-containing protein [Thermodesulfobacteriota bacterium]
MPHNLLITDDDIEQIGHYMRCSFADANRRTVLRCISNQDIQAGPGSGKTTLLVAKIAVLSSKWSWRDRGICVLSHTNVARQEVQKRLAKHPTAYKLLNYPHFIGTIQTFIDRFIALPFLRNKGYEVSIIDNDTFSEHALRFIKFPQYSAARTYLQRIHNGEAIIGGLHYKLTDNSLKINSVIGTIPGEHTKTYRQLTEIKNRITRDGIFRFDDMYAFGEAYLTEMPHLIEILKLRFPWVFIDEMQDTYAEQDRLIEKIFGTGCILQKFGDSNQAIFSGEGLAESETSFPKPGFIDLPESMRFGPEIAAFATPLTAVTPQTLSSAKTHSPGNHTILLFNAETIGQVLPAFGDLLLTDYRKDVPKDFLAKAVGFRKIAETYKPEKVPVTLADYWPGFQPNLRLGRQCSHLISFVRQARHLRELQGECREAYDTIIEGVVRLLHRQGIKNSLGKRFTKTTLLDEMRTTGILANFQELVLALLLSGRVLNRETWDQLVQVLIKILSPWTGSGLNSNAGAFLEWCEKGCLPQAEDLRDRMNLYPHKTEKGSVNIEITTIHAVKGETHTATLVLETYWYKTHDLRVLLPFIKNQGDQLPITGRLKEHMKRIFVAITRPKELLCLAIHKGHLTGSGDIQILQKLGWVIRDLTEVEIIPEN